MHSDSKATIKRPDVNWQHGLIRLLLIMAGGTISSWLLINIFPPGTISWSLLSELCIAAIALLTARSNLLLAIRLYQRYAPENVRGRCAMTPTCSEYAVLAIRRYGILRGSLMTYRRLRYRCDGTPTIDYP